MDMVVMQLEVDEDDCILLQCFFLFGKLTRYASFARLAGMMGDACNEYGLSSRDPPKHSNTLDMSSLLSAQFRFQSSAHPNCRSAGNL
jgi:hypothetical protein